MGPESRVVADTLWVVVTAFLVFFMNAGFAMLETGLCQAKNAVNVLAMTFIVFAVASLTFWAVGFGLMYGDGNPWVGLSGAFLRGPDNSPASGEAYAGVFSSLGWTGVPLGAKFLFALAFAGVATTIVSGAVAERIKFASFVLFSSVMASVIYPVVGHWIWGGGWLKSAGFRDFAGSTVVHSTGGWAALAGSLILGPRLGRYARDGRVNPFPGHNMGLATLGAFILWLGWYGFNAGSTMAANPTAIAAVALNTTLSAAAGGLSATATAWLLFGKPDLSMILNGTLAGLVAITAPCGFVAAGSALAIGAVAGLLLVFAIPFFDRLRIDDPVGALSVHLVSGIWGTLAVGLLSSDKGLLLGGGTIQTVTQIKGILAAGAFALPASALAWLILRLTIGIRVGPEEERDGLDSGEHGMEAYPGLAHSSSLSPEAFSG